MLTYLPLHALALCTVRRMGRCLLSSMHCMYLGRTVQFQYASCCGPSSSLAYVRSSLDSNLRTAFGAVHFRPSELIHPCELFASRLYYAALLFGGARI